MKSGHVVILDVVGLSADHLSREDACPHLCALARQGQKADVSPLFPALTIPVQASIVTGAHPSEHGMIANGLYDRMLREVSFWRQPADLVQGKKIWQRAKEVDPQCKTAVLFWQNIMFADADIVITPKPIHSEGGMVEWCYSKPPGLYESIAEELGPFDLKSYWGPLASVESSNWIARAAELTFRREHPNLMMVYLPHLDYALQREGPGSEGESKALAEIDGVVARLTEAVTKEISNASIIVLSEYAFTKVNGAACLNRVLRENGFLQVREIGGKEYPDFELSHAFAMVDHQIAHIYVQGDSGPVADLLRDTPGVGMLLDEEGKREHRIDHERAGELIAVAERNKWFAYYWWQDEGKAPPFAFAVDIHRKPGYDPCELFFDPQTKTIPRQPELIKGSHGAVYSDPPASVFFACGEGADDLLKDETITPADFSGLIMRAMSSTKE